MTGWRALADAILGLFAARGDHRHDELVTQTEHAVQSAEPAHQAGAPDALVAAALLHDVGHLLEPEDVDLIRSRDLRHEDIGARLLANWYPSEVTEPIRHHVAAKRYLCAVEPGYFATLSPASVRSLAPQGGAMGPAEAEAFAALPGAAAAVELRRGDDLAKRTDAVVAPPHASRAMLVELWHVPL